MAVIATHLGRFGVRTAIALMSLVTVFAQPPAKIPASAGVYAGVGEELIAFGLDVERATLTRQSSVMLPGFVQEAWASSTPMLYVAWSNGGASYASSGVDPLGDRHGITVFRCSRQPRSVPRRQ